LNYVMLPFGSEYKYVSAVELGHSGYIVGGPPTKNAAHERGENMTKGVIRTLRTSSLKLRRAVITEITQVNPSLFVARAPELQLLLSAMASTPSAAVSRLAAGIVRQYRLLAGGPVYKQDVIHAAALRRLRRFVKEEELVNASTSSGQKTQR